MNVFRLVSLFFIDSGESVYAWGRERIAHTVRVLYMAVVVPAILLVAGIASGMIGEATATTSFVAGAQFLIALSGFLAALLLALFWMKSAVLTHLFAAATRGASGVAEALPVVSALPEVEISSAEAFLKWMRGVTGWITLVCLYGMMVPIWRHLTWTLVVGTVFLFLSAAMTAEWVSGDRMRRIVIGLAVVVLVYATANLVSPQFMAQFRYGLDKSFGRVVSLTSEEVAMGEVEREMSERESEQAQKLVKTFRARQFALRAKAYNECGGNFCSVSDESEYRDLDRRIVEIKDGIYWSGPDRPEKEENTVVKETSARERILKTQHSPEVNKPPKPVSGSGMFTKEKSDRIWSELDKYDDL